MLVEVHKSLEEGSFGLSLLIIPTNVNSSIDHPHDKLAVLAIAPHIQNLKLAASSINFLVDSHIVAYFNSTQENKIVYAVVGFINSLDYFPHFIADS